MERDSVCLFCGGKAIEYFVPFDFNIRYEDYKKKSGFNDYFCQDCGGNYKVSYDALPLITSLTKDEKSIITPNFREWLKDNKDGIIGLSILLSFLFGEDYKWYEDDGSDILHIQFYLKNNDKMVLHQLSIEFENGTKETFLDEQGVKGIEDIILGELLTVWNKYKGIIKS